MRFRLVVTCVAVVVAVMLTTVPVALAPQNNGQANASTDKALVVQEMAAMPLAFTENRGQWDERVRFRASAGGATLWFGRDGITYQFTHRVPRSKTAGTEPLAAGVAPRTPFDRAERFMPSEAEPPVPSEAEADSIETVVVHAVFAGSNPEVELAGENLLEYRCNYFLGNDPGKWQTDVPNYTAVVYRNVYPGVDVKYEGKIGALTCSYTAASESDLAQVKFQYQGFDPAHPEGNAAVTETGLGQFRVEAPWGAVLEPLSSGPAGGLAGNAVPVTASTPGANGAALVTLVYSTFLGGSAYEVGHGIAVDQAGSAYVTGSTFSSNFPTQNPYDGPFHGGLDVFVTKLSPAGNALVYSTYLGGSGGDEGRGIAVDQAGSAYVTGYTQSSDFPTQNPYDGSYNGVADVFVTKLSPAGNALVYSTFLGGGYEDDGLSIAVDEAGAAYVTGRTYSSDFPTQNPYDGGYNGGTFYGDAFVTKLASAGNTLVYSTYLGGSSDDYGCGIAVDQAGSAHVTGWTYSTDFPTQNPYDGSLSGTSDVFVTKLSSAGNALVYSTYLGGNDDDFGRGITVDSAGSAYVTGFTDSPDFPTQNPYDGTFNGGDGFVTKLSPAGNTLVYSTYLGGSDADDGYGIAVDQAGSAYVTGWTYSTDFPTQNPYDGIYNGGYDVFVTKLSAAGNALVYSTYLGGSSDDYGYGIAVDQAGSAYVTGYTYSTSFPTQNPYDGIFNGPADVFVTRLSAVPPHISLEPTTLAFDAVQSGPLPPPQTFAITNTGGGTLDWSVASNQSWLVVTPPLAGQSNNQVVEASVNTTALPLGTHTATLTVTSGNADNSPQFVSISYQIQSLPHISLSPPTLTFSAPQNVLPPPSQTFTITNTGGGLLDWSISGDQPWLDVTPPLAGQGNNQVVEVSVNTTALPPGTHNATITIASGNADNSPQTVGVTYNVSAQQVPAQPIITDVIDAGTGSDLVVKWSQINLTGVTDFSIEWGTAPGVYDKGSKTVPVDSGGPYREPIPGLTEHTPYYVGVRAHNANSGQYSAYDTWPTPVRPTIPVVLAHGWSSDASIWGSMGSWLESAGFSHVWTADLAPCGVENEVYFDGNAQRLSLFIEGKIIDLHNLTGIEVGEFRRINIVAHSMGGLIARRYVSDLRSSWARLRQVDNLIMLGTPNLGSELAGRNGTYLWCPYGEAWWELTPEQVLGFNGDYWDHPGTKYWVAAGTRGMVTGSKWCRIRFTCNLGRGRLVACPNDGTVSVASATNVPDLAWSPRVSDWCHSDYYGNEGLFDNFIHPILEGSDPTPSSADQLMASSSSSPPQVFVSLCDSLGNGSVDTATIRIEEGNSTLVLFTSDPGLALWLKSPSGTIWDSLSVIGYPGVTYMSDSNGRVFDFEETESGLWTVHVDATWLASSGASYCLEGVISNAVSFDASVSLEYPFSGDSVWVSATVSENGIGLPGCEVTVSATQEPADTLAQLSLFDDGSHHDGSAGDGTYGCVFVPLSDSGVVSLHLVATGISGTAGSFRRQAGKAVYVLTSSGPGCDCPHQGDLAQNGVIDVFDVIEIIGVAFSGSLDTRDARCPRTRGDVNNDGVTDVFDVIYLIATAFSGGPNPINPCGS